MSGINSVSPSPSQYPADTQSVRTHHGKGAKAPGFKPGTLLGAQPAATGSQKGQNLASQTARTSTAHSLGSPPPTILQGLRSAVNPEDVYKAGQGLGAWQPEEQNPAPEEAGSDEERVLDVATRADGSAPNAPSPGAPGSLLDAFA
jgi:hypothetical protein